MRTIEIIYNPYKMITKMLIDGIDVCQHPSYVKIKNFIENGTPLQTWIEPIKYSGWDGFVNETSDPETNDEVTVIFSGRKIDFEDLKRSIDAQNKERLPEEVRVIYHYEHKKELKDEILSQNIEEVVEKIKSDRFRELVSQRTTEGLTEKYNNLDKNYKIAKESEFYIVLAGEYSSGKSTLINTLIGHHILPTSNDTCTSKNCRIRHDSSLENHVSLACYDKGNNIVIEKQIFDNDKDCAAAFLRICPIKMEDAEDKYSAVDTMELGVDLSHLYPNSVSKDKFTIVLVDTPGMDSALSSENGTNRHAEIALEAIAMESKPMIILCSNATKYESKSIGEFMKNIIAQAREEKSGFNDRFLFLMNQSDAISYNSNESAEDAKEKFAKYLTDWSKWDIKNDEKELCQIAVNEARFVPKIYMTSALVNMAIQADALKFTREELRTDGFKRKMNQELDRFKDNILKWDDDNFRLSSHCDIPGYRKDEISRQYDTALENGDELQAVQLQCGITAVESAIKDYIERYAYPIKVRGLLETFEHILDDVKGFNDGILADLKQAEKKLGEKRGEREGESVKKQGAEEKIAALEKAKESVDKQLEQLDQIHFDTNSLKKAIGEFQADIESDPEITFIRNHEKVRTGQKSHDEVEREINARSTYIKTLFEQTLDRINGQLVQIKKKHDEQIEDIFKVLREIVFELEQSGVFEQGEYKFTNSVFWKLNFPNIHSDQFAQSMKRTVVDKKITNGLVFNDKKYEWSSSRNPFKIIGALFMKDFINDTVIEDGHYETKEINQSLTDYFVKLAELSDDMEQDHTHAVDDSKKTVRNLIERLTCEFSKFLADIQRQDEKIGEIQNDMNQLRDQIKRCKGDHEWLNDLKKKIEGA